MTHWLYYLLFALFIVSTFLPLVIFPLIKKGRIYWPAFTFAVLAEGLPGIWLLLAYLERRIGMHASLLNIYLTGCVAFTLMIFLQGSALHIIIKANRS